MSHEWFGAGLNQGGEFRAGGYNSKRQFTGIAIDAEGLHKIVNGREVVGWSRRVIMYRRRYARGAK